MADSVIDFAGLDAQVTDNTATDTQTVDTQTEVQNNEQITPESPENTDRQQLDGRKGPQNIRGAIKAATDAFPDQAGHFKELGNAYFREQAYKQHFPTPQEAQSAKQLIEAVGGAEGMTTLQGRIQAVDAQDEALRAGNPQVLDSMFKDFPEGAVALAGPYLEKLATANPTVFSSAIAPHALAMIESAGLPSHLEQIFNEPDLNRKNALIKQAMDWFSSQKQNVSQIKQAPPKNPASDRIAEERKQLDTERENLFMEGVRGKVNSTVVPEIQKVVDQYAKSYKLNDTQKSHFQNTLQQRLVNEMNEDKTYKQQVDLRKQNKSRTHDSVGSYIASEFTRRLKDAAFNTAKDIYGAPKGNPTATTGVVKPETPKNSPSGGPIKVSQRPSNDMLDLNRPGADLDLIRGRGYTKDGRYVTWR